VFEQRSARGRVSYAGNLQPLRRLYQAAPAGRCSTLRTIRSAPPVQAAL